MIFFVVILLFPLLVQQNVFADEPPIMKKIRQNYNPDSSIKLEFDLSIFWSVREKTDKKSGSLILCPGNKFSVTIGDEQHISNGKKYWHYSRKASQVTIENIKTINVSSLPSGILQQFLTKNKFTQKADSGSIKVLECAADTAKPSSYKSIILWADKKGIITKLQTRDKNDNINTYTFHKSILNARVSSEAFEFHVPKNVQVLNNYD